MSHKITLTVEVTLDRVEGKFASRDDMVQALIEELEGSAPSELYGLGADGESTYEVTDYNVDET